MQASTPINRVVEALAGHGCNPKQRGRSWQARCPAHEDRNPSLSVTDSETGNVLVYCHAGCTTADVAAAIGLSLGDLFPPRPKTAVIPIGGVKAVYSYYDADGELAYQVRRFWPKSFKQRRPNGQGGWINNVDGAPKIPYLLPQIRRAIETGRPILVCEGEKDAENAQWWGMVGTCNSGGAGKWNDLCTCALDGADEVIIVADRDDTGRAHAAMVARSLTARGKVKAIRVVESDRGKDLTEHQALGGTFADLVTIDVTQEPTEALEHAHPLLDMLIDWPEFWSTDRSEEAWLAYPVLPEGRQIALYAPAKEGKSYLAFDIAASVATGRPILGGQSVPPRRVLYLDYEMTESDLQDRLFELGYGPEDDLSLLFYALLPSLPPLDTPEGAQAVAQLAALVEADLVVIDTFGRAVEGEENNADTTRNFYRYTGIALKAAGVTVLRTDHAGKDVTKGTRGSSAKNDDVDLVWRLTRCQGGALLTRTHSRISWVPATIQLRWEEDPNRSVVSDTGTYPEGTKELAERIDALGLPLDAGRPTIRKALKEAGISTRNAALSAAIRWRKEAGTAPGTALFPSPPGQSEDSEGDNPSDLRGQCRGQVGTDTRAQQSGSVALSRGTHPPSADPEEGETDPRRIFE